MSSTPSMPQGAVMTDAEAIAQVVNVTAVDGSIISLSLSDIDDMEYTRVQSSIGFGALLGAAVTLLLVLLLTTRPAKRGTPVFWLNIVSLVIIVIRAALYMALYLSPYKMIAVAFAGWEDGVSQSWANITYASDVLVLATDIGIMMSLIFQVRVVFGSEPQTQMLMTVVSSVVAVLPIAFWTATIAQNIQSNIEGEDLITQWLYLTTRILFALSICFFCSIFVLKLWMNIRRRRKLGFQEFGPLQVIFIMGVQSLIVPAALSIADCFTIQFNGFQFFVEAICVFNLPLSALWASAQADRNASNQRNKTMLTSNSTVASDTLNSPYDKSHHLRSTSGTSTADADIEKTDWITDRPISPDRIYVKNSLHVSSDVKSS